MGNVLTACSEKHKLLSKWDPRFIPKCRELNPAASDEMKGISGATIPTISQWQGQARLVVRPGCCPIETRGIGQAAAGTKGHGSWLQCLEVSCR